MADMLVNLLDIKRDRELSDKLEKEGIRIFRAMAPDKFKIVQWVKENSNIYAAGECDVCFSRVPISCYIAVKEKEILGYACYDATALNFLGPMRVGDKYQGKGIGKALLLEALIGMREIGYVYAIVGGIGPQEFYEKNVGAVLIENSTPGIYNNFIK